MFFRVICILGQFIRHETCRNTWKFLFGNLFLSLDINVELCSIWWKSKNNKCLSKFIYLIGTSHFVPYSLVVIIIIIIIIIIFHKCMLILLFNY
jgi:hypothetical protein